MSIESSMSIGNISILRQSRISKFLLKWVSNRDYYCWNDEEIFLLMSEFLDKYKISSYRCLQDNVGQKIKEIHIPNIKYSQLMEIFNSKSIDVAYSLNEISYMYLDSVYLFQFFKEQDKYHIFKSWSAHFNNVK